MLTAGAQLEETRSKARETEIVRYDSSSCWMFDSGGTSADNQARVARSWSQFPA